MNEEEMEYTLELPMSEVELVRELHNLGLTTKASPYIYTEEEYLNEMMDLDDPDTLALLNAIAYKLSEMEDQNKIHVETLRTSLKPETLHEYLALVLHEDELYVHENGNQRIEDLSKKMKELSERKEYTRLDAKMMSPIVATVSLNAKPYRIPLPTTMNVLVDLYDHHVDEVESVALFPKLQDLKLGELNDIALILEELQEEEIMQLKHFMEFDLAEQVKAAVQKLQTQPVQEM